MCVRVHAHSRETSAPGVVTMSSDSDKEEEEEGEEEEEDLCCPYTAGHLGEETGLLPWLPNMLKH